MYQAKTKTKLLSKSILTNLRVIIYSLALLSILTYLLVVNDANTKGIAMGQMKLKIQELQDQNRDLETQAAQLMSMQRIEAVSNLELSMVQALTYEYIEEEGAVAVKE